MTYNITLTANHQSLTAEYLPLAAESVQYLTAKVVCETEDWTGREIKALFGQGCTVYEIPVTGGEITAKQQLNLTAGDWRVWLVGNSARDGEVIPRITTNVAHISVAPTGGTEGNPFPIIPPTVEEQLRADMGNLDDLTTEDKSSLVAAINEAAASGGSKDAVTYTPQTLTEEQKSQARTNIGAEKAGTAYTKPASGIPKSDLADAVQTSLNKADAAISYDSQTLTEAQQKQARANIGAGQPVFAVNVTEVGGSGGYTADKTAAEIEAAYQAGRTIVCKTQMLFMNSYISVELPLMSRNQERVFIFAVYQLILGLSIVSITVNISDSKVEVSTNSMDGIYEKPTSGIPKSDLAEDVQTSLDKADTAISLGLTAAAPGQIIKVKAVQDGKPTEWEAVDMPSGEEWEKIKEITIAEGAEESNALTINADENGNTFRLKKARLCAKFPAYTGTSTIPNFSFAMINGKTSGRIHPLLYTAVWPKIATNKITGTIYYVDVSGAQQIEHAQLSGNAGWNDDTTSDYRIYGSSYDQFKTVYGDTLWAKPITSIGGSGMLIYPGCHFVLYGVRE